MLNDPNDQQRRFLLALFDVTQADSSAQVSMYDIGATIELDRDDAARVAESVMGYGWAEVKTLSGGIGISAEGIEKAQELGAKLPSADEDTVRLGTGLVLDEAVKKAVETLLTGIKPVVCESTFEYDVLVEIITDVRTIEIQLTSPRPKTAVVRACFESLKAGFEKVDHAETISSIDRLLA